MLRAAACLACRRDDGGSQTHPQVGALLQEPCRASLLIACGVDPFQHPSGAIQTLIAILRSEPRVPVSMKFELINMRQEGAAYPRRKERRLAHSSRQSPEKCFYLEFCANGPRFSGTTCFDSFAPPLTCFKNSRQRKDVMVLTTENNHARYFPACMVRNTTKLHIRCKWWSRRLQGEHKARASTSNERKGEVERTSSHTAKGRRAPARCCALC
jgi:hypothetical protein